MKKLIIFIVLLFTIQITGIAQNLSLDSCKIYALENNKRLKEANMQLEISEQVKKDAFTKYFPKIDAGAVVMRSNKYLIEAEVPEMNLPVYDGNPANLATATQFAYFPGMNLELLDYANAGFVAAIQPIYAGGRIRNGNKLASLGKEFSQHNVNIASSEVLVKTEDYYWTIVALQEKRKTINSYEGLLKNLLNDVTNAHNAGLIQKSDLLKVKLELNQIEANKLKLDNGISLLKMSLCQYIGIEYNESFNISDTLIDIIEPEALYNNPQESLLKRDEYQMLQKYITAELLQKKIAIGEYMPQLAVGVQGLYLDMMDQKNTYGMAFATLSIPISGWWGGSHKIQEHKIRVGIAKNNFEEKSDLLLLQMNKSYKDLIESYKQIMVAESSNEQAKEHLNVVKDTYDAGIVNTSDMLEAQAMYQQSQDAVVNAKTIYKIKQAYYLQSIAQ